jgi:hypothetical protein
MRPMLRWALASSLLLAICGWFLFSQFGSVEAGSDRQVDADESKLKPALNSSLSSTELPVRIDVYPGRLVANATEDASTVCRIPAPTGSLPWERWVQLSGRRVHALSDTETVLVYAARFPSGVAVLISNLGDSKAAIKLSVRLERGIHTVTQHGFALEGTSGPDRSDRLESALLKGPATLGKPVWLLARTAAVICFRDVAQELGRAMSQARSAVRSSAADAPRATRLVSAPLSDAVREVDRIARDSGTASREQIVSRAEKASFALTQALTRCRNLRASGLLGGERGKAVGSALERLDLAISDTVAVALDLVPNASWTDPEGADTTVRTLSAELRNSGRRTLSMVKISVTAPVGCRVSPAEPAVFRALHPGETVRATFIVQPSSDTDLTEVKTEYSYLARRSPMRLRLTTI